MNDGSFISTAEAGKLLGVHKKTVKRRTDSYLKANDVSPGDAKRVIEIREVAGKRKYFVSKEFVLKHLVQEGESSTKGKSKDDTFATKQLLRQLEVKDLQLTKKDDQIAAKDGQIGELNARLKESHILLQQEQQLHSKTLETKRPLLALRSSRDGKFEKEGSRRSSLKAISYASSVGFTALAIGGALIFYFL